MSLADDHRMVALRLHGLAGADRRWILSRMSDLDRIKLEGYLEELKGFQLDPETLAELESRIALKSSEQQSTTIASTSSAMARKQILAAEPLWLSQLLNENSKEHRMDAAVATLTLRAREAVETALEVRVLAFGKEAQVKKVQIKKHEDSPLRVVGIWARLREAWHL